MGERQCVVCQRFVPQGYEQDHLRANHLGPHVWWFNARKYQTAEPSMTVAEIKKLSGGEGTTYHFFQEREGGDICFSDGASVDLTRQPRFYTVPPATSSAISTMSC